MRGTFAVAFAKNDGGDTATAPPDASMQLLPASAGFLSEPSPATAANRSSRRTAQSWKNGRRRGEASSNYDRSDRRPHHRRHRRRWCAGPPQVPSSITTPVSRSAAKSKIRHSRTREGQHASLASRQEQLRWQFRSTCCSPHARSHQLFSGAGPSRCPVAGGRQHYRRPGRARADLTNNGLHPFLSGRSFTLELMQIRRHQTTGL
jgi:hypothetical protein